jgi:hypothetical protein
MRIAIVFFGLTRNLKQTYPSIEQYVFKYLKYHRVQYDVFLHTYHLEKITNHRSNEKDVALDNDEWKMLFPKKYIIEDQNEVDKTLDFDTFLSFENPWPEDPTKNSMRNLLRQLHSLKRAWQILETEDVYDGYLILRPDLRYMKPFHINLLLPIPSNVMYIPQWGKVGGENDRMCLTSREGARVYMNRHDQIFDFARHTCPNSHVFLKSVLDGAGILRRALDMGAVRIRAEHARFTRTTMEKLHVLEVYKKGLQTYKKKN